MTENNGTDNFGDRHPSTAHMMQMLAPNVNLKSPMLELSTAFADFALDLMIDLPDSPELTSCLRKLLEAKDCAVRAMVFKIDPTANSVYYTDR